MKMRKRAALYFSVWLALASTAFRATGAGKSLHFSASNLQPVPLAWEADPGRGNDFQFALPLAGNRDCLVGSWSAGVVVLSLSNGKSLAWLMRGRSNNHGATSPRANYFAFLSRKHGLGRARIFRSSGLKKIDSIRIHGTACSIALSRNGKWAAIGEHRKIALFSVRDHNHIIILHLPTPRFSVLSTTVKFGTKGRFLYAVSGQSLTKWNLSTRTIVFNRHLNVPTGCSSNIAEYYKGQLVVYDGAAHIWVISTATGKVLRSVGVVPYVQFPVGIGLCNRGYVAIGLDATDGRVMKSWGASEILSHDGGRILWRSAWTHPVITFTAIPGTGNALITQWNDVALWKLPINFPQTRPSSAKVK